MTITKKERMRRALLHEQVDHLPTQINYTAGMGRKIAEHFQITENELPGFLGNHMIRVDLNSPERLSLDGKVKYDW